MVELHTIRFTNKAGYNVLGNIVLVDLEYVPRIDNFNLDVILVVQYILRRRYWIPKIVDNFKPKTSNQNIFII